MKISKWRLPDSSPRRETTLVRYISRYRAERQEVLDSIVHDLTDFAIAQGYTDPQIQGALETFFETFAPYVTAYLQVGGSTISDAISNDVTIAWLDTDAGGETIRERLINRLS